MSFAKTKIALALGVATALISGVAVSSAYAVESNGSDQAIYQWDNETEQYVAPGATIAWDYPSVGSASKTEMTATFLGSADAVEVRSFISPRGQERTPSAWIANAPSAFKGATKEVLQPELSPSKMSNGTPLAPKASGGEFSIGFAFTKNNGLSIADAGVVYHYITITPGTGAYTFQDPADTVPTTPPVGSADINLQATTIAASDGTLSLVVPANATAVLGTAALVNNLSTSTGVLGDITVKDSRVVTHKGWTLTSTVTDFAAGASIIAAAQLSVTPKVVSTTAAGVTASAAGAASTTGKPFAEAGADAQVGDTVLNADLSFVAPAAAAAGTYTSKMTLTLVSK